MRKQEWIPTRGVSIVYLLTNQAWAVMFYDQMLRLFNTKNEAVDYAIEITEGV